MIKNHEIYKPLYTDKEKFIILITGGRACETPTQEVIMADMTVKMMKDVKVGDKLMGDDGTARTVLALHSGHSMMYRVKQTSGEDYLVNDAHTLSLRKSKSAMNDKGGLTKAGTYRRPNGRYPNYAEYSDINVLEYANASKHFRENFRGYKVGVIPYPESEVLIEPYMLGVWLGDGTAMFPRITNADEEVRAYLKDYCERNGQRYFEKWGNGAWDIGIVSDGKSGSNTFLNNLRHYGLVDNKHIPHEYIANSERVRLELLAGLLDTDGHMEGNGYDIIQKSESLAKQIKFIADTLGFRTSISKKHASIGDKKYGIYYRVFINGDTWKIPCKVAHKRVTEDMCHKNKDWRLSYLSVEEAGDGDWVGFTLDGNQRYLHADGTVTHNSGKSFAASTFIERLTFELKKVVGDDGEAKKLAHTILYARYTMTSAAMSVIPEFMEKVEEDGTMKYFYTTKADVVNRLTKAKILFRGIKTSSGNQTAKLKSIHGITTFVCDEAEEWTSEREFDTIMLSIRQKGIQNRIIIIMNPTDSNHFIYRKYIEKTHKLVDYDGVPVQISTHPNVLHIHTTYLDNLENLSDEFLKETASIKANNPEKYAHTIMGRWADVAEGAVFKKWGIVDEFPKECKHVARGLDFGYTCFRGDTLITTSRGEVPIKDVVAGDYVLTRNGYRKVKKNLYNGRKKVIEKKLVTDLHSSVIFATFEHNFNANGKWKKYGKLEKGDKLFVLSHSTDKYSKDTPTENTRITITTNGKKEESIIKSSCTMQSMSSITAQFPKAWSSITRTLTRSTTKLTTLLQSLGQSMKTFMENFKNGMRITKMSCEKGDTQKKIGTSEEKKFLKSSQAKSESANLAEKNTLQQTHTNDFAQNNVTTDGSTPLQPSMSSSLANGADKNSWETSTSSQRLAEQNVHISCLPLVEIETNNEQICDVYDLEVEGVHEYFANGFLVHNCDPSACVKCGVLNNDLYIDEQFYETGMLISDLARELKKDKTHIYSESADPRLVQELANAGLIIYPIDKSKVSIVAGIERLKDFDNIFVTKRSYNIQTELRNYTWAKDKDGNYINEPIDAYNHGIDSIRYWCLGKILGHILKPKIRPNYDLPIY